MSSKVKGTCPACSQVFVLNEGLLPPHSPNASSTGICEKSLTAGIVAPEPEPPPVQVPMNPACQAFKFCPGCGAKVKHGQAH